jgi:hypothetical protein
LDSLTQEGAHLVKFSKSASRMKHNLKENKEKLEMYTSGLALPDARILPSYL